jgi:hypothetical protein
MLRYTCYFFDKNNDLLARREFGANDNKEAVTNARELCSAHDNEQLHIFELWAGSQLVSREFCQSGAADQNRRSQAS